MFCEHCAPLTRALAYNPAAEPEAELMSGSCWWPDEVNWEWCTACFLDMRTIFHLRHRMTVGEPIDHYAKELETWSRLEQEFPEWPLFRPERRSSEISDKVRRLVHLANRRACIEFKRMEREYRRELEEGGT